MNPLGHHIHLGPTHSGMQRDDLAVDVGQGHIVVVDQVDRAHAAAGQRLHRIAANTAHTEHSHPAFFQFIHCIRAQQKLRAGKFIQHICLLGRN